MAVINGRSGKRVGLVDVRVTREASPVPESTVSAVPFEASVYLFRGTASGFLFEDSVSCPAGDATEFHGRLNGITEYVVSLPLELLDFRILSLPFRDSDQIRRVLPFELDSLILENHETVIFDSVVLGTSDDRNEILAVYMKRKMLSAVLDRLSMLGIDPRVVTSVEVRGALAGDSVGVAGRLSSGIGYSRDDRIRLAGEELIAPLFNLRSGSLAYTRDRERSGKALRLALSFIILILLVIHCGLGFRIYWAKKGAAESKDRLLTRYAALFPDDRKVVDELYQMKSRLREIQQKGEVLVGIEPLEILRSLSEDMATEVVFNEIRMEKDLVTMKGETLSIDSLEKMKKGLSAVLEDISVSDINRSSTDRTLFTLVGTLPR